jgi:hypothetical protein
LFSAALSVACATGGCVLFPGIPAANNPTIDPLQQELDANRAKWIASGIDTYEYQFVRACECPPESAGPIIVTVDNGTIASVRRPAGSELPRWEGGSYPVEQLFAEVQAAIDGEPDSIVVTYDAEFGYPTQIYIDWDAGTADEETAYQATDLIPEPLQAALDANLAKWQAFGVDAYQYEFGNGCACPPQIVGPTVIVVEDGEVVELRDAQGVVFEPLEGVRYPTIDELFDTVQTAVDRGRGPAAVSVRYDDGWGYPTHIDIDWEAATADEETSYSAANLIVP